MMSVKHLTLYTLAMQRGRRTVKVAPGAGSIKDNYNYDRLYAWDYSIITVHSGGDGDYVN